MPSAKWWPKLWLVFVYALLVACSEPQTGAVDVKWDRDACERCRMVLSDRQHSAQVRGGPADRKAKVKMFDDFGCAVLWLDNQTWKDDARTEIWVNDHRDGRWIDARQAWYVKGQITPMEFGLGAQDEAAEKALNYTQAAEYIREREAKFNQRGVDLRGQSHEH